MPIAEIPLIADDCFILADKEEDLSLAFDQDDVIDFEPEVVFHSGGETTSYMYGRIPRVYKGISVEKLREIGEVKNAHMADMLLSQSFTDMQYVYMGLYSPEK